MKLHNKYNIHIINKKYTIYNLFVFFHRSYEIYERYRLQHNNTQLIFTPCIMKYYYSTNKKIVEIKKNYYNITERINNVYNITINNRMSLFKNTFSVRRYSTFKKQDNKEVPLEILSEEQAKLKASQHYEKIEVIRDPELINKIEEFEKTLAENDNNSI